MLNRCICDDPFFLAACVGTNESLKQGQELAKDNRWEEAIIYFKRL